MLTAEPIENKRWCDFRSDTTMLSTRAPPRIANGLMNRACSSLGMLKTLNVTDSDWTVPYPHLGSIGKQLAFPHSCEVAQAAGYDAVNLDVDFALEHGPQAVTALLEEHDLTAAAFRFPVKITDEGDEAEFERGLAQFEREAAVCKEALLHSWKLHPFFILD